MKSVIINLKNNMESLLKESSLNLFLSWILFTSFFCYQFIIRLLPNSGMSYIVNYYSIDPSQIGQFMGLYYIFYTVGHIPIGILIDKFGSKKIGILSIFFIALSLLFMISYSSIYILFGSRIVIGFFSAAAILCLFKEVSLKFSAEKFGFILSTSIVSAVFFVGVASFKLTELIISYGFDKIVIWLIIIGVFLMLLILLFVKDTIADLDTSNNSSKLNEDKYQEKKNGYLKTIYKTFSLQLILIILVNAFMMGAMEGFQDTWSMVLVSMRVENALNEEIFIAPSMILWGHCFASPILGFFSKNTLQQSRAILFSAFMILLPFIMLLVGPANIISLKIYNFLHLYHILLFLIGMGTAYQIPLISYVAMNSPKKYLSLSTSICNMFGMSFGYFFHSVIGIIIDLINQNSNQSLTEVFGLKISHLSMTYGLSIIPLFVTLSIPIVLYIIFINKKLKR